MTYKAVIEFNSTAASDVASTTQTLTGLFDYRFGESILSVDKRTSSSEDAAWVAYPWSTIVQCQVDSEPVVEAEEATTAADTSTEDTSTTTASDTTTTAAASDDSSSASTEAAAS